MKTFIVETVIRQRVLADTPGKAISFADKIIGIVKTSAPDILSSAEVKAISYPDDNVKR